VIGAFRRFSAATGLNLADVIAPAQIRLFTSVLERAELSADLQGRYRAHSVIGEMT
jgi:hypothetical protein